MKSQIDNGMLPEPETGVDVFDTAPAIEYMTV